MTPQPLVLQVFRHPERLTELTLADWDLLLRQATSANLVASICALLDEADLLEQVPLQAREHLEWSRTLAERHIQAVHWEVRQIQKALANIDTPVILLKGAAYVEAKLPPYRGRLFSDIDIMVPKDLLGEVEAALMMHGWAATHHDAYDQRYYRTWMHELPPMQHVKRQSVIDVHHAILPETSAVRPDPEKLRAATLPLNGQDGLRVFAPVDLVLHSVVHLFYDGELDHGLRDLIDIHGLLAHFSDSPTFWDDLVMRAQELELTRPLFYALRYAAQLLGTPVPVATISAAGIGRPNTLLLAIMDQLFGRALLPVHTSCSDWLTGSARILLYVRATWLRMPPLMLARHLFHKAVFSRQSK